MISIIKQSPYTVRLLVNTYRVVFYIWFIRVIYIWFELEKATKDCSAHSTCDVLVWAESFAWPWSRRSWRWRYHRQRANISTIAIPCNGTVCDRPLRRRLVVLTILCSLEKNVWYRARVYRSLKWSIINQTINSIFQALHSARVNVSSHGTINAGAV